MRDDIHTRSMADLVMGRDEVSRLTRRAFAERASDGAGQVNGLTQRLVRVSDAFIAPDANDGHEVLAQLRKDGVSRGVLVDHIGPAVARLLGDRWLADDLSFGHVTIGAARLQAAVRTLGRSSDPRHRGVPSAPAVLLAVPRGEHHTLGTFVLADQLRRRGMAVDTAVDLIPAQLHGRLRRTRYNLVGFSVSGRRVLALTRELVNTVRASVTRVTPVIVGGPVLDRDLDVRAMTGADHTARDARAALEKCGAVDAGSEALPYMYQNQAGIGVTGGEG
jgi:methanogenic corrinoid protein MtbC1